MAMARRCTRQAPLKIKVTRRETIRINLDQTGQVILIGEHETLFGGGYVVDVRKMVLPSVARRCNRIVACDRNVDVDRSLVFFL